MLLLFYTLQHLAVDGICGAALAAYAVQELYYETILYYFCMYNLIAFGSQWLMGYLLDRHPDWIPQALLLSLATLGIGTVDSMGISVQVVCLGIGNCMFHVAAGGIVLRRYTTYKELGCFVSSGAIGLGLGLNQLCSAFAFLTLYAALTLTMFRRLRQEAKGAPATDEIDTSRTGLAILTRLACLSLLLGCVILRSFGGGGDSTEYVMLFPCVFALGKALGGLCCDCIGFQNTSVLIFLLGFLALQGGGTSSALLLVLAFNMTMPLTLRLVHWCNPSRPGMMFGLAAGCLLPGALFSGSFWMPPHAMVAIQFLCLIASFALFQRFQPNLSVR